MGLCTRSRVIRDTFCSGRLTGPVRTTEPGLGTSQFVWVRLYSFPFVDVTFVKVGNCHYFLAHVAKFISVFGSKWKMWMIVKIPIATMVGVGTWSTALNVFAKRVTPAVFVKQVFPVNILSSPWKELYSRKCRILSLKTEFCLVQMWMNACQTTEAANSYVLILKEHTFVIVKRGI